jgi:hypothetical protein
MRSHKASIIAACGLSVLMFAVGTNDALAGRKSAKRNKVTFSGFMDNYEQLQRADQHAEFLWGYTKRPMILQGYPKVIVDPILIYFHPDAEGFSIDPAELAELTEFFRDRIIDSLSSVREIEVVDQAGPGVMRWRIAITEIDRARGGANAALKGVGIAAGVGLFMPSIDIGGATMECEVLDAVTGERLVAIVDKDDGRRMMNFKSVKSMGDAKGAMKGWAEDFRKNLQRIHEDKLPKGLERAQRAREKAEKD